MIQGTSASRIGIGTLAVLSCIAIQAASAAGPQRVGENFTTGATDELIDFVNTQVRQGWTDNEVKPSDIAEDSEWVRRVYLDIIGRIPSRDETKKFIESKDDAKRADLIDKLLENPDFVRNWTSIWTNHCIGRATPRRVSRSGMQKFFRESFARNRPWDEVVVDIITSEGHFEENGAVNYLLAQMALRDDGVQLTAKTAKLFLGIQVQCTQCHNHPFNDWKQDQFWQFNSFFRQTDKRDHREYNPETGRMEDTYSEVVWKNINDEAVYFEKRSGLMQVAYPEYMGKPIDKGIDVDRRQEFAKLITDTSVGAPLVAQAMVNRMWGHFFGYGFTRPVDDMGPHNPASHPEVVDRLSAEFVDSGYDIKQLIRWIANSEAYNLTSQFNKNNELDNPAAGETPLFSHMYVKSMQAEQLYDSLIMATNAHQSGRSNWEQSERQRRNWMQQFFRTFGTDENDEATTFNGTIPQALMMMNSQLMERAVSTDNGSYLHSLLSDSGSDMKKVQDMYLTAVSRLPNRKETTDAGKLFRRYPANAKILAYQDLFWALLNSNEFIFVH